MRLGNRQSAGILFEAMLDQTLRPPEPRLGRLFEASWGVAVLGARIARTLGPAVPDERVAETRSHVRDWLATEGASLRGPVEVVERRQVA